jgi:hypothetical protein
MDVTRFAPLVIALTALLPAVARAQLKEGNGGLSDNAALQYWQGFSQLPVLDKDQEKLLTEPNSFAVNDPAVTKLLGASHQSLTFLHRGAELKNCDWGLYYKDGISMLMPHLAKSRDLARLAALDARRAFENGNWKAGRRDMTSMMVLARHVGRDPVMISLLVRLGIEGLVVDTVAPYVSEIKASHTQALEMFAAMPRAVTLEESILWEKEWFAGWIAPKLREEEQRRKGAGMELWNQLLAGPDTPASLKEIKTLDEAIKRMEEMLPAYDEMAKLVALPPDQFEAQYPEFKQRTKARYPLTALILPAIDQLRAKEQRQQARMAMLLAGIAIVESGPGKLAELKDPFGAGPFEYRALDKGFELNSKLHYEGQPVTLTIGQRK